MQELTHDLMQAEDAFNTAKEACVAAGVDACDDDRASGFVDDAGDGYRLSQEVQQMASVAEPKIASWLGEVDELVSPSFNDHAESADDWPTKDVDISDSRSLVAEGSDRKRMDKWRQICGL